MSKKQSSVEWLEQQFQIIIEKNNIELEKIWQQLKAMHKEEMKEMYLKGIENYDTTFKRKDNETFGGQDNEII